MTPLHLKAIREANLMAVIGWDSWESSLNRAVSSGEMFLLPFAFLSPAWNLGGVAGTPAVIL